MTQECGIGPPSSELGSSQLRLPLWSSCWRGGDVDGARILVTPEQLQIALAAYRTRLAEQRTALSLLQFGILLVSIPLTLHGALVLFGQQHLAAARLHVLVPLWAVLGSVAAAGMLLTTYAARRLFRSSRACGRLRRRIEPHVARLESGG